jgi:hypothetical protein
MWIEYFHLSVLRFLLKDSLGRPRVSFFLHKILKSNELIENEGLTQDLLSWHEACFMVR